MSDLSLSLQQAQSQLPASSYFDPALYALEMQNIFQQGPRYVGHSLSVPNVGDYYALPQENGGRALVRNAGREPELADAPKTEIEIEMDTTPRRLPKKVAWPGN